MPLYRGQLSATTSSSRSISIQSPLPMIWLITTTTQPTSRGQNILQPALSLVTSISIVRNPNPPHGDGLVTRLHRNWSIPLPACCFGFVVRHIEAPRPRACAGPVLPDQQRSQRNVSRPNEVSMEGVMAFGILADK